MATIIDIKTRKKVTVEDPIRTGGSKKKVQPTDRRRVKVMIYEVTAKNESGETYTLSPVVTTEPGIDHVIKAVKDSAKYTKGDLIIGARVLNDGDFPALDVEVMGLFITIRLLAETGHSVLDHPGDIPLMKLHRSAELCRMIKNQVSDAESFIWAMIERKECAGDGTGQ